MTNAQSKLYSTSQTPATRNWGKNVTFIDESADNVKKLLAHEDNVAFGLSVNVEKEIVPIFAIKFANKEFDDGSPDIPSFYIVANGSDEIPSKNILKAPSSICNNFLVLASKADVGRIGVGLDIKEHAVPVAKLAGTVFAGKKDMLFLAPPSICPVAFGKNPIHGSIDDSSVIHDVQKLGKEYEMWLRLIKSAINNKEDIDQIFDSLSDEEKDKYILNWESVELGPNAPFSVLSPLNMSSIDEESDLYEKARDIESLFKNPNPNDDAESSAPGPSMSPLNTPRTALTRDDIQMLAEVLDKDPDAKRKKLTDKDAKTVWKGFFIRAEVDWNIGTCLRTAEGILSPGFLEAFDHPTASRGRVLKRFIESSFETPADDEAAIFNSIIQDRSLVFIDSTSCNHILAGNIQKMPVDSLVKSVASFDQLYLASQKNSEGKIAILRSKDLQRAMERDMEVSC
jgi:hypothetical protein